MTTEKSNASVTRKTASVKKTSTSRGKQVSTPKTEVKQAAPADQKDTAASVKEKEVINTFSSRRVWPD